MIGTDDTILTKVNTYKHPHLTISYKLQSKFMYNNVYIQIHQQDRNLAILGSIIKQLANTTCKSLGVNTYTKKQVYVFGGKDVYLNNRYTCLG